jgi:hypothetical protein
MPTLIRLKQNKTKTPVKSMINIGYLSFVFIISYNTCLVVALKNAAFNTCLVVALRNSAFNTCVVVALKYAAVKI